MKIYLFKQSEEAPEYMVRTQDSGIWFEVGTGTRKKSKKGTEYLEVDFEEAKKETSAGTKVPDWIPNTPEQGEEFAEKMDKYDIALKEKYK